MTAASDRAGMRHIAPLGGMSAATVSRCLRGTRPCHRRPGNRVHRAASDLDYTLPSTSRSLAVGVLARSPTQWFFAEAISGIEAVLAGNGYTMLLHNIGDPDARERFFGTLPVRGRTCIRIRSVSTSDARTPGSRSTPRLLVAVEASAQVASRA